MFMLTLREVTGGDVNFIYEEIDTIRWQSGVTRHVLGFVRIEYNGKVHFIKPNAFKLGVNDSELPEGEKKGLVELARQSSSDGRRKKRFQSRFFYYLIQYKEQVVIINNI